MSRVEKGRKEKGRRTISAFFRGISNFFSKEPFVERWSIHTSSQNADEKQVLALLKKALNGNEAEKYIALKKLLTLPLNSLDDKFLRFKLKNRLKAALKAGRWEKLIVLILADHWSFHEDIPDLKGLPHEKRRSVISNYIEKTPWSFVDKIYIAKLIEDMRLIELVPFLKMYFDVPTPLEAQKAANKAIRHLLLAKSQEVKKLSGKHINIFNETEGQLPDKLLFLLIELCV